MAQYVSPPPFLSYKCPTLLSKKYQTQFFLPGHHRLQLRIDSAKFHDRLLQFEMSDNVTRIGQSEMSKIIKLRGPDIFIWALALMTVCFRLIARQISKEEFWYDDCLILLSTVSNLSIRVPSF